MRPAKSDITDISGNGIRCTLCWSLTSVSFLCDVQGYRIWRCSDCAFDFVWPVPDEGTLSSYYNNQSYFEGGSDQRGGYDHYDKYTERVLPVFHELLTKLEADCAGRKVLDIGCGYATHLGIALERGWTAFGVERSAYALQIARERHGDRMFLTQDVGELPGTQFDLILLLDVIEHLCDPYSLFGSLFSNGAIGPNTRIAVTTPNARSHSAIADPGAWVYRHPPSHLAFYSGAALTSFFETLGFRNVQASGLHPVDEPEVNQYDREAWDAGELRRYAGLLCEAGDCDVAGALAQLSGKSQSVPAVQELISRNTERQLRAARASIVDFRLRLAASEKANAEMQIELETAHHRVAEIQSELASLKGTKLFRLRHTLLCEPLSLRKIAKVGYLTVGMVTPRAVRRRVGPLVREIGHHIFPSGEDRREFPASIPVQRPVEQPPASVSIVIPTKNAGPLFEEVLQGLNAQTSPLPVSLTVIDSGSTDQTVSVALRYGANVLTIRPEEFDHGQARDIAIEHATGDIVVLLTQDAVPGDRDVLTTLLRPFSDSLVAGVYGRQVPRQDANVLTRKTLDNWLTGRTEAEVRHIDDLARYSSLSALDRYKFCNFDNVCSAIRRSVWKEIHFGKNDFAEDLSWGKRVLEAGWKIAYEPRAFVIHSHDRSMTYEYKRTYLCHRKIYSLFGLCTVPSPFHALIYSIKSSYADAVYVAKHERDLATRARLIARVPALNLLSNFAQYRAARDERNSRIRMIEGV